MTTWSMLARVAISAAVGLAGLCRHNAMCNAEFTSRVVNVPAAVRQKLQNVRIKEFRGVFVVHAPPKAPVREVEQCVFQDLIDKNIIRKCLFVDGAKVRTRMDNGEAASHAFDSEVLVANGQAYLAENERPYGVGGMTQEMFWQPRGAPFKPVVIVVERFDCLTEPSGKCLPGVKSLIISLAENSGGYVTVVNIQSADLEQEVLTWKGGYQFRSAAKLEDWAAD